MLSIGHNLTLEQLVVELMHLDVLQEDVPVYKGGKSGKNKDGEDKKIGDVKAHDLITKAINGECTEDELMTLHNQESVVNDVLKMITAENADIINNENKNIINRRLFHRGAPSKISEEVQVKMTKSVAQEIRDFNRLLKEGEFRSGLKYTNAEGKVVTLKSWALCDKDYVLDNGAWFIVPKKEAEYFQEHGHFPLRKDNSNSKLGSGWIYLAFELAWVCSGEAHGGCQCPEHCYAKRMETVYKNVRDRVLRSMNAWQHVSMKEKVEFYVKWISYKGNLKRPRNGIRFCDTGDVTNQKLLDEIFELVRDASAALREKGIDPVGRFYIYSTRADLDWSNKPWELVLNASNEELFRKVPDANWFRVVDSFDDIPDEYKDPATLHICNCNCKACDYCAVCRNQVIWEVLG